MNLLALELSTLKSSVAFQRDGSLVAEEICGNPQPHGRHFFTALVHVMAHAQANYPDIDVFAVGRGPGSFSGIRAALTAANAFALPGKKSVIAVSSGEILAADVLAEISAPRVAVIGDARRGTLWYGVFDRARQVLPWSLTTLENIDRDIPADATRVSADWDRLAPHIHGTANWIQSPRFPTARTLGQIVMRRIRDGQPGDPGEPLYMHPAV